MSDPYAGRGTSDASVVKSHGDSDMTPAHEVSGAPTIPKGRASSATGSGPKDTPMPCNRIVAPMVTIVPNAIRSPWAKLENRRMPDTKVPPQRPRRQLAPIGSRRDQNRVRQHDKGVQKVHPLLHRFANASVVQHQIARRLMYRQPRCLTL